MREIICCILVPTILLHRRHGCQIFERFWFNQGVFWHCDVQYFVSEITLFCKCLRLWSDGCEYNIVWVLTVTGCPQQSSDKYILKSTDFNTISCAHGELIMISCSLWMMSRHDEVLLEHFNLIITYLWRSSRSWFDRNNLFIPHSQYHLKSDVMHCASWIWSFSDYRRNVFP